MIDRIQNHNLLPTIIRNRTILIVLVQGLLITTSYLGVVLFRLDMGSVPVSSESLLLALPMLVAVRLSTLAVFRLHQGLWRYVSVTDLLQIIKATTLGSVIFAVLAIALFDRREFPLSIYFVDWAANILLLGGIRMLVRLLRERFLSTTQSSGNRRLLIIGAGDAGAELCRQALNRRNFGYQPVAFVDDDPGKIGTSIFGVPIAGSCQEISEIAKRFRVEIAVVAIPSATHAQRLMFVQLCDDSGIPFRILPNEPTFVDDEVNISRVREFDAADLLGRPSAVLNSEPIRQFFKGKRILVTGAAGSVGSELARQIAGFNPGVLCLIDRAENPLMYLEIALRNSFPDVFVVDQVGDVTDQMEMTRVMAKYKPDIVFHAAAHKHVHLMERTPGEAVKNNIGGTYITAKCAQEAGVETFVLVSTDKAVKPSSVMGTTKRVAEMTLESLNQEGPTRFLSVRFGNVLGSNASVVPIFKQQIAAGGPVTVTDPNVERYFMSISEAAGLILQAGSLGTGGEIMVLDMGEPVKILGLAETLIRLSGLKPYQDVDIVFTGLRSGEKLTEELHLSSEDFQPTSHGKIHVLKTKQIPGDCVNDVTDFLRDISLLDDDEIRDRLHELVPEYRPTSYFGNEQASTDIFHVDPIGATSGAQSDD